MALRILRTCKEMGHQNRSCLLNRQIKIACT
ncbi:MAG: hypothetical protein U0T56_03630 [Ferruginibacter sp.]